MTYPLVCIIILNFNRHELTIDCLDSAAKSVYPHERMHIIVVDNASQEESILAIKEAYPEVDIIANSENLGYAEGNNVGIEYALTQDPEYVFILNDDTTLEVNCLNRLVQTLENDPRIGADGPMIFHCDQPEVIQSAGGGLDFDWHSWHFGSDEKDEGQSNDIREVEWLSGCAILVRAKIIQEVGLFDKRFFCYWEDVDWCVRMRQAGWKLVNVPTAKLWHKGGTSNSPPTPMVTYYMTRNKLLLLKLNNVSLRVWIVNWVAFLRTWVNWTINPKWKAMHNHRNAMQKGMIDFLRSKWGESSVSG